jgi:molecular chaperone Hsp33
MLQDHLLTGLLIQQNVRVVAAVTGDLAREAARRHGAVGGGAAALGRGATAGLLLATLTKSGERLTAQLSGGGPLGTLMVDAATDGAVRVYTKNPATPVAAQPGTHVYLGRALGKAGVVRVARDLGLREIVSGQTPLVDGEIDTDLEHYLLTSEQIPSALGCETLLDATLDPEVSGGVLLQTLPGSDAIPFIERISSELRAGALARALLLPEPPDAETLVRRVLGDEAEDLLVLDTRPVRFFCPCTKERAAGALGMLGERELEDMAAKDQGAEVTCDFCRARHRFNREELEKIRADVKRAAPS